MEMAGLAPGPLCGQMLADYGARVIRVDRAGKSPPGDQLTRGKESIALDLQSEPGKKIMKKILANTDATGAAPVVDVLIDTYRPGVLERLDILPSSAERQGRQLVVARLTGYGQTGPYSHYAGHDINYLAASGVLDIFGPAGKPPVVPSNILGDFASLSLPAFASIVVTLFAARNGTGGSGGVLTIDVNIVDSLKYMAQFATYGKYGSYDPSGTQSEKPGPFLWTAKRGHNVLEGLATPFYTVYETADNRYVSVGALEPQFFDQVIKMLGIVESSLTRDRLNPSTWPSLRLLFASKFKEHDYDYWVQKSGEYPDACVMPAHKLTKPDSLPPAVVSRFTPYQQNPEANASVKGGFKLPSGRDSDAVLSEFLGSNWRSVYGPGDYVTQHKSSML